MNEKINVNDLEGNFKKIEETLGKDVADIARESSAPIDVIINANEQSSVTQCFRYGENIKTSNQEQKNDEKYCYDVLNCCYCRKKLFPFEIIISNEEEDTETKSCKKLDYRISHHYRNKESLDKTNKNGQYLVIIRNENNCIQIMYHVVNNDIKSAWKKHNNMTGIWYYKLISDQEKYDQSENNQYIVLPENYDKK